MEKDWKRLVHGGCRSFLVNKPKWGLDHSSLLSAPCCCYLRQDALEAIEDMREYDVGYVHRFAIDMDVRAGQWFMVSASAGNVLLKPRKVLLLSLLLFFPSRG